MSTETSFDLEDIENTSENKLIELPKEPNEKKAYNEDKLFKIDRYFNENKMAAMISNAILENEVDSVKVGIFLKQLESLRKIVLDNKEVKEKIVNDTLNWIKEDKGTIHGYSIKYRPTYTTYNYSVCNHKEWNRLNEIEEYCKLRKKEIEVDLNKFTKKVEEDYKKAASNKKGLFAPIIKNTKDVIVEFDYSIEQIENGEELIEISPAQKVQVSGLVYTRKKQK